MARKIYGCYTFFGGDDIAGGENLHKRNAGSHVFFRKNDTGEMVKAVKPVNLPMKPPN